MKKILYILISAIIVFCFFPRNLVCATDEIMKEQQETLGITSFLEEAEKYSDNIFEGKSIKSVFSEAISGSINNKTILKSILNIFSKETKTACNLFGTVLIIIIIHSIVKSISENLENKEVGKISYYVQYIIIVTLVMANFGSIVSDTKETIQNLVRLFKFISSNYGYSYGCNRKSNNCKRSRANINI